MINSSIYYNTKHFSFAIKVPKLKQCPALFYNHSEEKAQCKYFSYSLSKNFQFIKKIKEFFTN